MVAGMRPTGSISMGMFMQDYALYDPLDHATSSIAFMCTAHVWDNLVSLRSLADAWRYVDGQMRTQPSWGR
eukprot:1505239-Pyramimonas_sp.AAC.1